MVTIKQIKKQGHCWCSYIGHYFQYSIKIIVSLMFLLFKMVFDCLSLCCESNHQVLNSGELMSISFFYIVSQPRL